MTSNAFDDFIDDCFLSGDEICRISKYETRINFFASKLIDETLQEEKAA